jgi:hypothetical protein
MHAQEAAQMQKTWDGNRTTPVHLIPLKDEFDQQIIPTEMNPLPFSSRFSCEPCHDYDIIRDGFHFNAASSSNPGRAGEPWVWVDQKTGTLLPLSYRQWKGCWHPEQMGLTPWDFTLLFGRHLAGGGISEPPDEAVSPGSRWEVSGRIEVNCLGCHNASNVQDPSEWAKQVLRQNFRWAATASAGLGEVGGMASRLTPTWDVIDGPNPDDTEWAVPPFVRYDRKFFDSKHRAFLDILHKPADSRCLVCHSVTPAGAAKFEFEADVHSAAGLNCVSCHRNDIRHAMIRGYEGEAAENLTLDGEDFTCAGCHLGGSPGTSEKNLPGRLGAPYPRHKGFPAVHFKRLSCTVCHSGPWPEKEMTRVRTSRANRLGIYGIARWDTDLPTLLEPAYIRDGTGKLAPNRLLWPAFWVRIKGESCLPLQPEQVQAAAGDILNPEKAIVNILTALTLRLEADQTAVLVLEDKVFELNVDGALNVSSFSGEPPAAGPFWAVRRDGEILPLVPEFDPSAEEIDPDIQDRTQTILEGLAESKDAPGSPVLLYQGWLFQVTETYLEKLTNPAEPELRPRLAWRVNDKIEPLVSPFSLRTIAAITGSEQTLTEEQVELILKALAEENRPGDPGEAESYAYVSGGRMFRLGQDGRLESADNLIAAPVTWPLAHEVRPARQSLGIHGCKDCHRVGSEFLFRTVEGTGPLKTTRVRTVSANAFMRLDRPYQMIFGLSFAVRPLFKWILFVSILAAGSIVFLVILLGLGRLAGLIEKRK